MLLAVVCLTRRSLSGLAENALLWRPEALDCRVRVPPEACNGLTPNPPSLDRFLLLVVLALSVYKLIFKCEHFVIVHVLCNISCLNDVCFVMMSFWAVMV